MPLFSRYEVRDGGPEWRKSDWQETDGLHHSRACPRCHADVTGGQRWRDHWTWHRDLDDWLNVVRVLVKAMNEGRRIVVRTPGDDDDGDGGAAPVLGSVIIGNGPLPAEMTGGAD